MYSTTTYSGFHLFQLFAKHYFYAHYSPCVDGWTRTAICADLAHFDQGCTCAAVPCQDIGAASRSCIQELHSASQELRRWLSMGAAYGSCAGSGCQILWELQIRGSCVQPLPSRCQRVGAAMELRRNWAEGARAHNRCRNLTFQVKFRCFY